MMARIPAHLHALLVVLKLTVAGAVALWLMAAHDWSPTSALATGGLVALALMTVRILITLWWTKRHQDPS